MKDINDLLKAAQEAAQTIQAQMTDAQGQLDKIEVEGASGGGLVRIRATAKGRILGVAIDDSLLAPSEKSMLEDLVARRGIRRIALALRPKGLQHQRLAAPRGRRRPNPRAHDSA